MSALPGPFSFLRPLGAVGGTAIGFAVGHGVSPAIRPVIQDLANQAWELHQVRPLEPSIAAQLVAEEMWSFSQGRDEAARSGINEERFNGLIMEARRGPTIEQAYDGVRRGVIGGAAFEDAMRQAGIRPEWDELMRALINVQPSVTDMVRFAVREVYDSGQRADLDLDAEFPPAFATDAEKIGIDRELAGKYWAAHWDLPSYEQLAQMRFRGLLSPQAFRDALKAIDYAPTWRDKLEEIARRIPTIPDMVRFAVREVYNAPLRRSLGYEDEYPEAFTAEAAKHGLTEEHARQYWWAHWRLPSARQGYQMLWRGEITEGQLDDLLKALDYPSVWRDRLANIARIVPGRIDLKRMLRHGIKDRAGVKAGYQRLGYAESDAEFMTQIAEAEVGAGSGGSSWLGRARTRLYTVAHNEYLDDAIDEARARGVLSDVGVPAGEIGDVITMWDIEQEISRLELTPAQIKKAYTSGRWTLDEAIAALAAQGMTAADADDFLGS